jgi:phage terminase small subunit
LRPKTRTEMIDGMPVLIKGSDTRFTHRANKPLPRKTRVDKKWLGVKVPKMELMTLRKQQRDALGHYMALGMDTSKKTEAGVAAGWSASCAAQNLNRVLAKPFVQQMMVEALEKHGVTLDRFAEVIADGLDARHPMAAPDENGDRPKDFHAIHKFAVTGLELNDAFPAKKSQLDVNKRVVTINLTSDDHAAFDKFQRMRKEKQDAQIDPTSVPGA